MSTTATLSLRSDRQLPKPRVNYSATEYQEMAEKFIDNGQMSVYDVPELIKWRRHFRDLRHIVTGAKTEKGITRTLPDPTSGICRNLRLLREGLELISSVDIVISIAKVWPVYEELYSGGHVVSLLYPIPKFPETELWKGKALRYRLSLISFAIRLLTAIINRLRAEAP